jgi:uncharacterized protein with FMN-binding domain
MKKYLQITIVLGLFFSLAILKNLPKEDEEENIQVGANNSFSPQAHNNPTPQLTNTPLPASVSSNTLATPTPQPKGQYKDGNYTGKSEDAYYGNVQVKVTINNGRITDVIILDRPQNNGTSNYINSQAMPMLIAEAISVQSANINMLSGASYSSPAFQKSLASALAQAK